MPDHKAGYIWVPWGGGGEIPLDFSMMTEETQGKAMARKTFCTFDPNALAMAAAGLFCWAISTEATALGKEVPMAHTVMPGERSCPRPKKR